MENNKRNFKNELKDFWNENRDKIKIGLKCLGIGLAIGFVKGGMTGMSMQRDTVNRLIDKIPYEPDCDDIADYVHEHLDELKPYYESEIEYAED